MIPRNHTYAAVVLVVLGLVLAASLAPEVDAAGLSHVVQPGETLEGIARRYGTTLAALASLNQLPAPYAVSPGQTLTIFGTESVTPAPPPAECCATPPPGDGIRHVARGGETLEDVARRYGTSSAALAALNDPWPSDELEAGQAVQVTGSPLAASPQPRSRSDDQPPASNPQPEVAPDAQLQAAEPQSPAEPDNLPPAAGLQAPAGAADLPLAGAPGGPVHVVQPGETLEGVARRYGARPADVARANSLDGGALVPGAMLVLGTQASASSPATGQACAPPPQEGEALVARVNTWGIGLAAFEQRWNQVVLSLSYLGVDVWGPDFVVIEPQARHSVLDLMIDEALVQQWAATAGVTADEVQVQSHLDAMVAAAGGQELFETWLEQTGQSWESYRRGVCQKFLDGALLAGLADRLPGPVPSDTLLARWLQTHRATSRVEKYAEVAQVVALPGEPAAAPLPPSVFTPSFLVPPEH